MTRKISLLIAMDEKCKIVPKLSFKAPGVYFRRRIGLKMDKMLGLMMILISQL